MPLATGSSLHQILDLVVDFLPQLGLGFLALLGLVVAVVAFGGVRRRRAASSGPATGEAFAVGLEGEAMTTEEDN